VGTLKIDALGTSFTIQAKEDTEYLQNLLSYFKQVAHQVEAGANLKNNLKNSILTGIMLCDELYKEKLKNAKISSQGSNADISQTSEVERIALKLLEDLDKVID
jgi:cell division protein ZapA